jgi:hypothetical protein
VKFCVGSIEATISAEPPAQSARAWSDSSSFSPARLRGKLANRLATLVGRVARGGGKIRRMPLYLTYTELETAVKACRAMAFQEGARAKHMENPTMRAPIENAARRYAAMAERFEEARKRA